MAELQIDTVKIRECGSDIINLTKELTEVLSSLYSKIEKVPIATREWTGIGAREFVARINMEKQCYDFFKNNLLSYGNLLISTADKIETSVNKEKL